MRSTFASAGKRISDDKPTSAATKKATVVKNPKTFCTRTSDECMASRQVGQNGSEEKVFGGKSVGGGRVGKFPDEDNSATCELFREETLTLDFL